MFTVLSADGTRIAYDRRGRGPAVVLVGGAFQVRGNPSLTGLAEHLSDRFTVYAYDRRGRGDSTDTAPYAVEREIEDLGALIGAAGGSAALFGVSSGAALALRAARVLPVTRLAVYEPPFVVDDSRPPVPGDYLATVDRLIAGDRRAEAIAYFTTAAVGLPAEMTVGMEQSPFWPVMLSVAHTIGYDGRVMGESMSGRPLGAEWGEVPVPTLVLAGSETFGWLRTGVAALAAMLPQARHVVLDGQTHEVRPAVVGPLLAEFLAD
ncbi:alpha/beta hydrolase [Longispora sp. K20-0274]|uniref:alpha/beta fold hydrolase n=1 Tax=Longispora sp. K20-0274 TaxID=3088255 RepID=UPI00399C0D31